VLVILPTLIGTALGLFLLAQALFPKPAGGGAAGVGTPHEPLVRPNLLFAGLWLAVASLPAWFLGIIPGAKEGIDTAMGGAFNTLQLIVFGFASLAILLWTSTFVVLRGRNRYLAGSVVLVLGWGLLLAWLTPAQREELLWGVGASAGLLRIPAAILLGMATFPSIRHAYSRSGRKAGIRQIARVVPAEVIASGTMLASLVLILPLDSSSQSQLRLVAVIVVLGCALASLAWFALSQERAPQTLTGLSGQESSEVAAHALETFNTDHP
jgi:hypothetical protein